MLNVPTAIAGALAADRLKFAWLLSLGDDLHFTNHAVDIIHDGTTYASNGDLLRLPSIPRERKIKLQEVMIEFSNADNGGVMARNLRQKYNSETQQLEFYDRVGDLCEIHLVLLDDDDQIVGGQAINLYRGALDSWSERDSGQAATISVKITSPWSKANLTAGRSTTDHNQQDNYPGDRFFEFAHEEKEAIEWGAKD